jgi:CRP-like cAMP-binding protein
MAGSVSHRLEVTEDFDMAIKLRRSFDPKSYLAKVGKGRRIDEHCKGQIVYSQGDRADAVYYLKSGKVKSTIVANNGKEAIVAIIGPQEFFGESCLAGHARRMSTVETLVSSVVARMEKKAIRRIILQQPTFVDMLIARLLDRTVRIEADLADQLCNSSEKRLARLLLLLANFGNKAKQKRKIARISQETLAAMIGTTRSRVSFFMNKFRKLGLIDYNGDSGGGIEVHSLLLDDFLHEQPQTKA